MSLISILTPFKNTSEFLPECIESVQSQTYTNWELILVDDGSTDESLSIAAEFVKADSWVQLLTNEGTGIIEALKLAYSHSRGTLITRMDSDDIMHPQKLEIMSGQLQEWGIGHLAVGQVKYFGDKPISIGYLEYEGWLNAMTNQGTNFLEIYKECPIPSPAFMVHKSDLDKCGGFDSKVYPEDYDLAFRFYKGELKCIPCSKVLHNWRDYDQRTSKTSEHYSIPYFVKLKTQHFLDIDRDPTRQLTVWGVGDKGKEVCKVLQQNNHAFKWISVHPGKLGQTIAGKEIRSLQQFEMFENPQSLITLKDEKAQEEIKDYMDKRGLHEMLDYFFFC